jgi:hypothetical protein
VANGYTEIVFADEATAADLLAEIACTPLIDGAGPPVWLWPELEPLRVEIDGEMIEVPQPVQRPSYALQPDGTCIVSHPFDALQVAWLQSYLAGTGAVVRPAS